MADNLASDDFDLTPDPTPEKLEGKDASESQDATARPSIIPPEIANRLPPQVRETLEFGMTMMGPMPNPIAQQITSEHIAKIIDNQEAASARRDRQQTAEVADRRHARTLSCVAGVTVLIVLGIIWGLLPNGRLDSFKEIAKDAVILIAGGFGGYGYAYKKLSEKKE